MIIIGTGAVAAEITMFFPNVNGYLEYPENILPYYKHYNLKMPVLGTIDDFVIKEEDCFVLGVANIEFRKKCIEKIKSRGGKFINLIHHSSVVSSDLTKGEGNIISPFCIIDPKVEMGNFNLMTAQTAISHDCKLGDNNFFSSTIICGHVTIRDNNYFGVRSSVIPDKKIGSNNTIQAGQIVDRDVTDNQMVFHRFRENVMLNK